MAAFRDELIKISVSKARLNIVAKDREGTRPISVSNFLKKEKEGTLYKHTGNQTKVADYTGYFGTLEPVSMGPFDPGEARRPKKKGEVPSKEDLDGNGVKMQDLRESATTTSGIGESFSNIGAAGNSVGGT
jgi:hypothetical protein